MYDPYILLVAASLLVALSYVFDIASKKLKIPSVLFLMATGYGINQVFIEYQINTDPRFLSALKFLGVVGLIMIVLEAAIDLKITNKKLPTIRRSFLTAFFVLVISSFGIGYLIHKLLDVEFFNCLIYAIPLSVVSSAVLIPSVHTLTTSKKEFLIYESTFSDIIGIMFFNFVVLQESDILTVDGVLSIVYTLIFSVVVSIGLVFLFSKIKSNVKIFLMLSILAIIYSIGKKFHLSSLLMIFIFGLILNNASLVFRGWLKKQIDFNSIFTMKDDFHIITGETAFILRTFFFVAFGMSLDLGLFMDIKVLLVGSIIVVSLYLIRYLNFTIINTEIFPEIFLAPRGLITILLFFQIPTKYKIPGVDIDILFFVILATGLIMMAALLATPNNKAEDYTIVDYGLSPIEKKK